MNKIKDIIMSGTEPSVKENGWLVPNKDGKLELKFFGPNGWETVSSGGTSRDDSTIMVLPTIGAPEQVGDTTMWTRDIVERALAVYDKMRESEYSYAPVILTTYSAQALLYVLECNRNQDGSIQALFAGQYPFFYPMGEAQERMSLLEMGFYIVAKLEPTEDVMTVQYIDSPATAVQSAFTVDGSLSYENRHLDNPLEKDILSIADGGVTLAKLAPDVPIYQPPKITLSNNPKEGDVIPNWTRDVWDRVNNIELQSIKINNATYWTGQKSTDKLSAICSYSAIQNDTLGVIYIQIDLAWDTATNQTKITEYIQSTNKAIQTPTLPTIKTLPDFEEGITEWTAADFNACRNGFKNTPKVYHQVFIEGKLYIPIWVSNNEEEDDDIILGSMETTTDNLINTAQVRVRLKGGNVYFWNKTSHVGAGCVTRIFDDQNAPKLVGFLGDVANFQDSYGVDPSVLFYTEGTLTVKGYWFNNVDLVSLTAVSCTQTDTYSKAIFSDGTNIVTVYHEYDPDDQITITSTPVLTEGQAPTMTQFDALSTQVGNIDTVLTQIMGE